MQNATSPRDYRDPPQSHTDFNTKMEELGNVLGELGKLAPQAARDSLGLLADKANTWGEKCEENVNEMIHQAVGRMKEEPVKIIVVAADAVLMAWWLLREQGKK